MGHGNIYRGEQWQAISTPDVYFTQQYYQMSALLESDVAETVLLEWNDDAGSIRMPLIVRNIPGTDFFDATSAYGYGGPWSEGSPNLIEFRQFFDEWAHANQVVSSFLRFHPLLDNALAFSDIFRVKKMGQTAAWDLSRSQDLVSTMASNHRRNWRKAERAGVEPRITLHPAETASFEYVYEVAMDRLSADSFYHFSTDYWAAMRTDMRHMTLQADAVYEGRVIASVWCLLGRDYLHFHLNGTTDEARELRGAFVAHMAAAQWGRDNGYATAHLGGGYGGATSALLDWKHRYDPETPLRDFYIATVVHDTEIFEQLASRAAETSFFPPWRAQTVEQAERASDLSA